MIARLLGALSTLLVYFCAATLVALVVILGYVCSAWQINQDKLLRIVAIARGAEPAQPPPKPTDEDKVGPEQVSYQQVLDRRALKVRDLELREQSLANALDELKSQQLLLAKSRQEEEHRAKQFETQLAALKEGAQTTGREVVRRTLETVKPKQAKEQLWEMLQANETDEVVLLLAEMPESRRAKILAEFKTPDESKKLADVLRRIREGQPEASIADQAQQPKTAGP